MTIAISVIGKDRPGIIAALAGTLYRSGGNLEDASMTILEGEFAMIFLADVKSKTGHQRLIRELRRMEAALKLVISIREIKHRLVRGEKHRRGTTPWVISVLGKDRAGIVYSVSKTIADEELNITDLNSKIIGSGQKATYALILEVDIPSKKGLVEHLRRKFEGLEQRLKVKIRLNPLDPVKF